MWQRVLEIFGKGDDVSRRLIVGLGNPGKKYEKTRHNIGFEALRCLADRWGVDLSRTKFRGVYGTGRIGQTDAALLEPQTFMNRSGQSVQPAASFFDTPLEEIIVFHDDIDLEVGQLKIKEGGGHGGHNGLRDITARMGKDFVRIRLGVGRPEHGDVTSHVLGRFAAHEYDAIDDLVHRGCDAVEVILDEGVTAAQNRFHR